MYFWWSEDGEWGLVPIIIGSEWEPEGRFAKVMSTTTLIYSTAAQIHFVLLSSEQNVQECDATKAQ